MSSNTRLIFTGMNSEEDVRNIDGDSFRFHGTMKSMFYRLLRLINPPPKEWLDRLEGNSAVLRDIYLEYAGHEKQGWRWEVYRRVIPFALCLIGGDRNHEEVLGQWFLYRICEEYEKGRFTFDLTSCEPMNWWADQHRDIILVQYRGSSTTSKVIRREELK